MSEIHISKETLTRIISDLKQIKRNPLEENGIYYIHDESNIMVGYALIIPKNETAYQYGNYLFSIEFPPNYPYAPPKVLFMTNNGTTRFHPNLYRNGKVCLSLLNTWKGDQWTSCNTLTSVLMNMLTLFDENPFLNEPGITEDHTELPLYNTIIEYQNFNTAIYDMLFNRDFKRKLKPIEPLFKKIIKEQYNENKSKIMDKLEKISLKNNRILTIHMPFYRMEEEINYPKLIEKLKES